MVAVPDEDPLWDGHSPAGRQGRDRFSTGIPEGLQRAAREAVSRDPMTRVRQDGHGHPSDSLARPRQALRQSSDPAPESVPGGRVSRTHFINQAAPDIQAELEQLDKGARTSCAPALKVTHEVSHGREDKARSPECQVLVAPVRQTRARQPAPSRQGLPGSSYRWGRKGQREGPCPWGETGEASRPCYRCGRRGHRGAACPRPREPPGPCPRCREWGHWAVDCPSFSPVRRLSTKAPSPSNLTGVAAEDAGGPGLPAPSPEIRSREPTITITVAGRPVSFLVETDAPRSVLPEFWGQTYPAEASRVEVAGQRHTPRQTPPVICLVSRVVFCHSFLVNPRVPVPLLGRDLLTEFAASVTQWPSPPPGRGHDAASPAVSLLLALADADPAVGDACRPRRAHGRAPVVISLKDPQYVPYKPQPPLPPRSLRGLQPVIGDLLRRGRLRSTSSPCNSPIMAVAKPDGSFRLVQDLRLLNAAALPLPPAAMPRPDALLFTVPATVAFYSVVDVKDACFAIPLHPSSQDLFAFTWTEPGTRAEERLTWTVLPQGFRDSTRLFTQALARDLRDLDVRPSTLLQYVDDLLLCSPSRELCEKHTAELLHFLDERGYEVSLDKLQAVRQSVTYLGVQLTPTHRAITAARKDLVASYPVPSTKSELLAFLGRADFFRTWVPDYPLLARPLYEASRGQKREPFSSPPSLAASFRRFQRALLQAPALRLADSARPFFLHVTESQGFALGVLGQQVEGSFAPVAYLSKALSPAVRGQAPCLRALHASSALLQASRKLTGGAPLSVLSHHRLSELLTLEGRLRLSAAQRSLVEGVIPVPWPRRPPHPPTLLPGSGPGVLPGHSCVEVLGEWPPRPARVRRGALRSSRFTWFAAGSSSGREGAGRAGYAVVSASGVVERGPLPLHTTPEQAELVALTRAFRLAAGRSLTVYTDSRPAVQTVLSHAAIWRERGFLTAEGTSVINGAYVAQLLEASFLPSAIGIVLLKAHRSIIKKGHSLAKDTARQAALSPAEAPGPPGASAAPAPPCRREVLKYAHDLLHPGAGAAGALLQRSPALTLADSRYLAQLCGVCGRAARDPGAEPPPAPARRAPGGLPALHWQVEFTPMRTARRYRYLLVFVEAFSGWVEAFPTPTKGAPEVARRLRQDIIPRFGLPASIQTDGGPGFVSSVTRLLAESGSLPQDFHLPCRPQSSGKGGRAGRLLKQTLAALSPELRLDWLQLLPLALSRWRASPREPLRFSPFEVLYGCPPLPLFQASGSRVPLPALASFLEHLCAFLWKYADQPCALPALKAGDLVDVSEPYPPRAAAWEGPYPVILSTPAAVLVQGRPHWIHLCYVRRHLPRQPAGAPA